MILPVLESKTLATCQINANNDIEAVRCWLSRYNKPTTFRNYKREIERFLLWVTYERRCELKQLKANDFEAYFQSLRYFGKSSVAMIINIIGSLMTYLVNAHYLMSNPMKLLKTSQLFTQEAQERKYKVWARMLEEDEWLAIQQVLADLPDSTEQQVHHKLRSQFLFSLLYLLGLRIHEVANHSWNAFRQLNGQWWFMALGKGDKPGHIPVNDQMLSMIKIYRLHLNKIPLPLANEAEHLIVSKRTKNPLSVRQLFNIVKDIAKIAADAFKDNPDKYQKLLNFSPHWLRHLSASHQDKAGIRGTMIQANHRHGSFSTTQIYLHAEDERRALEMQKLRMDIEPRIVVKEQPSSKTKLTISLTGNPINEEQGLERFLLTIEQYILNTLDFKRIEDIASLITKYQKIKLFKKPLEIVYELNKNLHDEELAYIHKAVVREAKMRLFEVETAVDN